MKSPGWDSLSKKIILKNCIFDTGSAGTTFDADLVAEIGITFSSDKSIRRLITAGGFQYVYSSEISSIALGDKKIRDIEIEVGDLTAKFKIDGIIGNDIIQGFEYHPHFFFKLVTNCD